MEQPVRRSDVHSKPDSARSSPDRDITERLRHGIKLDYTTPTQKQTPLKAQYAGEIEHDVLEFRLFAPSARPAADTNNPPTTVQRIRIRSPSIDNTASGFIIPGRGDKYYFTGPLSTSKAAEFAQAAVASTDIIAQSHTPCYGNAYAWRVLHISSSGASRSLHGGHSAPVPSVFSVLGPDPSVPKRTRPGKKQRVKSRRKLAEASLERDESARLALEREAAEREKRTRRNREKKVKKKVREKVQKAGARKGFLEIAEKPHVEVD